MPYAFDEFRRLASKVSIPISDRDPVVRYMCALIAELAYHHVPQFEIDNKKRAMIVPCEGYRAIVARGIATNIEVYLQGEDFPYAFVAVDRGVIAVGILVDRFLFIGFRGTRFLYDWRINLRAPLVPASINREFFWSNHTQGRVHRGFAEEAVRISARILDALGDKGSPQIDHVFLVGHSLGGAVAALSEKLLRFDRLSTIILGTPRYCDVSAYYASQLTLPTQIARLGDMVPFLPPRSFGYADHPYAFDTSGTPVIHTLVESWTPYFIWRLALFFAKRCRPHDKELYRRELGLVAKAQFFDKPLVPYERL